MLSFLFTMGCARPVPIALSPVDGADPSVIADVSVTRTVDFGWQVDAALVLRNTDPRQRRRMDLSRAALRADGAPWELCRRGDNIEDHMLVVVLEPGEEKTRTLRCVEIIEPRRTLALRVPATLTDSGSGVVILEYERVDR